MLSPRRQPAMSDCNSRKSAVCSQRVKIIGSQSVLNGHHVARFLGKARELSQERK